MTTAVLLPFALPEAARIDWTAPVRQETLTRPLMLLLTISNAAATAQHARITIKNNDRTLWFGTTGDVPAADIAELTVSFNGGSPAEWTSGSESRRNLVGPTFPNTLGDRWHVTVEQEPAGSDLTIQATVWMDEAVL